MEIKNFAPQYRANTSFGMAFKKPSAEVMQVLEKEVDAKSLKAFVEEQAKAKYFDITSKLDGHTYNSKPYTYIIFDIVPKPGVNTLGYGCEQGFRSDGLFPNHVKRIRNSYKKDLDNIYANIESSGNRLQKFLFRKLLVPIANYSANKEIKNIEKNHPERTILPALRAAGDKVIELEKQIERASDISKVFDA